VPEHQYLSIGEVLGLLLEDFPDVTISKIRFLESQGLIEPERTPSGYRKFYDHDVDLLRAILHEQKANFLPLKVIRDRIESGTIDKDSTGGRTPPRGIRNVDTSANHPSAGHPSAGQTTVHSTPSRSSATQPFGIERDSVFRRTDGGPEWAEGKAIIPGDPTPPPPITTAVPIVASLPVVEDEPEPVATVASSPAAVAASRQGVELVAALIEPPSADPEPHPVPEPEVTAEPELEATAAPAAVAAAITVIEPVATREPAVRLVPRTDTRGLPFSRDELCAAAGIDSSQLEQLESFGIVAPRGTGADATFGADAVDIAKVAGLFLAQGIDARHLRAWRQAADREATLFEQRIMPLLRQRNPQSRQLALDTLSELAELGGKLHTALVSSLLRHHYDGM
jgi:DNA-binding transcriptional MerR regulator